MARIGLSSQKKKLNDFEMLERMSKSITKTIEKI